MDEDYEHDQHHQYNSRSAEQQFKRSPMMMIGGGTLISSTNGQQPLLPSSPPSIAVSSAAAANPIIISSSDHQQISRSPRHSPRTSARPLFPAGSPCPAIPPWPAPPPNPRAELKPTAIAAPLATPPNPSSSAARSPFTVLSAAHSPTLHHVEPSPSQMSSLSPHPSPIPSHSPLLSMLRVVPPNSDGMGRETELRQKIQSLEQIVAEYELQKLNVLGTFTDFRERVAERERRLEAEYSHKIIDLSEEVLGAKRDFEERMKSFQILQAQFEREKEQALEKLRQDHQREIQTLEQRFSQSQLLNLEQKYIIEIQHLEEERKELRTERGRLGEEFERKLRLAESLFQTELTAAKMLYTRELQALKEHEKALNDELAARQDEFHDRLMQCQHTSRQAKDELNHCRKEVSLLEKALSEKTAAIQRLTKELAMARRKMEKAVRQFDQAKAEVEDAQKVMMEQKQELEQKAEKLREAEEARERLDGMVRELRTELIGLRNRVELLEEERDSLRAQGQNQTQLHDSQVTALEAMLKSVTEEKEECGERCKEMVERQRTEAEEREMTLRREFSTKLGELEEQYNGLREHVEQDNLEHYGPENVKLWEEIECLRSEKGELERELATERTAKESNKIGRDKLAQAIQQVKQRAGIDTENKGNGDDDEGEDIVLAVLLDKLKELEEGIEGIMREKDQMKEVLEQLEDGEEMGLIRKVAKMERERAEMEAQVESHRRDKQKLETEVAKVKRELEEGRKEAEEDEGRKGGRRNMKEAELMRVKLREAETKLEQAQDQATEELRKRDEQHTMILEAKIRALNEEHERTVELMQQRGKEMEQELEQFRQQQKKKMMREKAEECTQTDEGEEDSDAGEERMKRELERARWGEKEKEELIRMLKEQLEEMNRKEREQGRSKGKEGRSKSIAGEHMELMCQQQATEGEWTRKECRRNEQSRESPPGRTARRPTDDADDDDHDVMGPTSSSASSSLLQPSNSQRSLLSPNGPQPQQMSPSRQILPNAKNGSNGAEKRPAWRF